MDDIYRRSDGDKKFARLMTAQSQKGVDPSSGDKRDSKTTATITQQLQMITKTASVKSTTSNKNQNNDQSRVGKTKSQANDIRKALGKLEMAPLDSDAD